MKPSDISEEWLSAQTYSKSSGLLDGIVVRQLKPIMDGRGELIELWSRPWVEELGLVDSVHVYQTFTDYGVVKCWHLHEDHTDQFTVTRGKLQLCMVDLRESSPTYLQYSTVVLGTARPLLVKIPPGVLHGWKALSQPEVMVTNFQNDVYVPDDEYKFKWNCILEDVWEPKNG